MQAKAPIISSRLQNIVLMMVCVLAMVLFFVFSNHLKTFERNHISSDVVEYYSFVPAAFKCKDLSFSSDCPKYYWAQTTKDGKHVNKRSIGMAYMYTPFYFLSQLTDDADDGYTKRTQKILVIGIWIYVCIGLFFLGKALFRFFSTFTVVTTLLLLISATNLIWYTNGEPLFTHGVNFMWFSILIYFTILYHHQQKLWSIIVIALSVSMLALIRPNNLLLGLFPLLYGVFDKASFLHKVELIKRNYGQLLLAGVIFIIPAIPQLMYWRYATGNWVYYSYQGEKFYWGRPLLLDILFSFRKGWLIYTPIMVLSVVGVFYLKRKAKEVFLPVVVLFPLFLYIISCWWAWSYGGCYGMRPMIDIYPLLAFPFAAFIYKRKWFVLLPVIVFMAFCIRLNVFQAWQYSIGLIHFDQMNRETYFSIWKKEGYPADYDLKLSYPDYQKEVIGKGSYYSLSEISQIEFSMKFIRAKFVCSTDSSHSGIKADHKDASTCDAFVFIYNAFENKYAIRSSATGYYFRHDRVTDLIYLDEPDILKADLFEVMALGENKFALKAKNGFYITSTEQNEFRLKADAVAIGGASFIILRKYIR